MDAWHFLWIPEIKSIRGEKTNAAFASIIKDVMYEQSRLRIKDL